MFAGYRVLQAALAAWAFLGAQEIPVPLGPQAAQAPQAHKAHKGFPDLKVGPVPRVVLVPQGLPDKRVHQALKAPLACLVLSVVQAPRAHKATRVLLAPLVLQVLLVPLVLPVLLVPLAVLVQQETQAHKDLRVPQAPQAPQALLGHKGQLVIMGRLLVCLLGRRGARC